MWTATIATTVAKRAFQDSQNADPVDPENPTLKLAPWGIITIFFISVLFLPLFILVNYTVRHVFITLATIENPNPPSYEAVADEDNDAMPDGDAMPSETSFQPITSDLRRTFRLIYASGGVLSLLRGLRLAIIIAVATGLVSGIVGAISFVPSFMGSLITMLAMAQLHTAWVHSVIRTDAPPTSLWNSLPPFRRTLEATCFPILAMWLANTLTYGGVRLASYLFGVSFWGRVNGLRALPPLSAGVVAKVFAVAVIGLVLTFFLIFPTSVVFVRVQASLLPPDQITLVPFDRSFGGSVEPAVVDGKGFVTAQDAFRTVSRPTWRRLIILYVKYVMLTFALYTVYSAVVLPVMALSSK